MGSPFLCTRPVNTRRVHKVLIVIKCLSLEVSYTEPVTRGLSSSHLHFEVRELRFHLVLIVPRSVLILIQISRIPLQNFFPDLDAFLIKNVEFHSVYERRLNFRKPCNSVEQYALQGQPFQF